MGERLTLSATPAATKERPILFSDPLVQAILDGRKTETRRVMKPQPRVGGAYVHCTTCGLPKSPLGRDMASAIPACGSHCKGYCDHPLADGLHPGESETDGGREWRPTCPYGAPGDRLWVREAFRAWTESYDPDRGFDADCDLFDVSSDEHNNAEYIAYRATPRVGVRRWLQFCNGPPAVHERPQRIRFLSETTSLDRNEQLLGPWKPSIFMPRWACRIRLEVAEVHAERLQEITGHACLREGIERRHVKLGDSVESVRARFRDLWDFINLKRGFGWDTNPWVWVVKFKLVPNG